MPQEFDVVCLGGGVAGETIAVGLQSSWMTRNLDDSRSAAAIAATARLVRGEGKLTELSVSLATRSSWSPTVSAGG